MLVSLYFRFRNKIESCSFYCRYAKIPDEPVLLKMGMEKASSASSSESGTESESESETDEERSKKLMALEKEVGLFIV